MTYHFKDYYMDVLSVARGYVSAGLSVIPVKADGSKAPLLTGWRKYTADRPDDDTLQKWFGNGTLAGIGVPAGPASGNLVVLDFEHDGKESAYFEWYRRLSPELRQQADNLPTVSTPSGGRHIWIRLTDSQPGAKLARYANGKTKIEIRGEGHQVLAPGCPAECHKSGRLYEWVRPDLDPSQNATPFVALPQGLWQSFLEIACQCNEYLPPEQPRDTFKGQGGSGQDSPGNDFNRRGSWEEAGLFGAGWHWCKRAGDDKGFLTRPGKDGGISASVGMVSSRQNGYPYLYVWSTSTDFAAETPYSRFAVYAMLKHGGDFSEAAKDLQRQGYGERPGMSSYTHEGNGIPAPDLSQFSMKLGTPNGEPIYPFDKPYAAEVVPDSEPKEERIFKWMSELSAQEEDARWVWKGYLARGGITLWSALFKSGKSTLFSHLLKALERGGQFLGQEIGECRVLYCTEEHEGIWADRRDQLMIGNHVGMICQPFRARPTMAEWREFLNSLTATVRKYQFDLIVFDTLSKMWPVREENDAGQVEEALMPLWSLSQENIAVCLVHHTRKSGGEQFVASRGSGGLPAFCEILVEFGTNSDDPKDCTRTIKARGRYRDIPATNLVELTPAGYVSHGEATGVKVKAESTGFAWEPDLQLLLLDQQGEWLTGREIQELLSSRRGVKKIDYASINTVLAKWHSENGLEREGEGKKGSPFVYRIPV
jgi:hypothetical protein